jgi:hypothetical protein
MLERFSAEPSNADALRWLYGQLEALTLKLDSQGFEIIVFAACWLGLSWLRNRRSNKQAL